MGIDFQLVMPSPPQCYYTVPTDIAVQRGAASSMTASPNSSPASRPLRRARQRPLPDGEEAARSLSAA